MNSIPVNNLQVYPPNFIKIRPTVFYIILQTKSRSNARQNRIAATHMDVGAGELADNEVISPTFMLIDWSSVRVDCLVGALTFCVGELL